MISGPEKFRLPTVGRDKVEMYVNWTKAVDNCGYVKMRINDGDAIMIPKTALIKLAMYLGNEDEQDKLIPTRTVNIREYRKVFTIKLREDLKAGQEVKFVGTFDVPVSDDVIPILDRWESMGK